MPLTEEEIAAIKAAENPMEHEVLKPLASQGFKIRSEKSEQEFLDRYKNDVIEKTIPERIREVHTRYDEDIKGLTGIDRNQDEKSYDYLKRAFKEKSTSLENQIAELSEKAKKGGDPEGIYKQQIEQLKAQNEQLQGNLQSKADEIAQITGKYEQDKKKNKLLSSYAEIKADFKKDLPDYFKVYESNVIDEVLKNTKEVDGVLVPLNADGTVKKDADLNPISIKEELRARFKDVIDTKKPGGSGGSGSGGKDIDPDSIEVESFTVPAEIKDQEGLMTYMLQLGLQRGSEKFNKIWKANSAKLPLKARS